MKKYFIYETTIGPLLFAEVEGALTDLTLDLDKGEAWQREETAFLQEARLQLEDFLAGRRRTFELPLNPQGTPFQQAVWQALLQIPFGETRSYKEIAEHIGKPKACRAIGMANNRNPIFIAIPCHRVIGANGSLVGYGGGLDLKQKLLQLEAAE
jgi:methylated-DNA-[protein]-cysteine S-methyltransferase